MNNIEGIIQLSLDLPHLNILRTIDGVQKDDIYDNKIRKDVDK